MGFNIRDSIWENKKPGATESHTRHANRPLKVSVTRAEHGGKPRHFLFASAFLARLFKMPMTSNCLKRSFAIDFLLQSPQGLFNRLAFF
jgi:hypothetical protein